MGSKTRHGEKLRATLCEIERGLFHATYRRGRVASEMHALPAYQVGDDAFDAKQRIEQSAQALGYEAVIWETALMVPPVFARQHKARALLP
jgi:hypothetical protein